VLTPNDMGVAAFKDTQVTTGEGGLELHWRGRVIRYAPANDD